MADGSDPAAAGHEPGRAYGRRLLGGPMALLRWSHGSRYAAARALAAAAAGRPLLDYGCGDGTFLRSVADRFPRATGVEIDPALVEACSARFTDAPGVSFVHTSALADLPDGSFGVATCMEVLEHCTPGAVDRVLADLRRLVAAGGTVIVSVPVETGPALVGKQLYRAAAARRGLEGYRERERYAAGEMLRMVFAGRRTAIERPTYETRFSSGAPNRYHGHKGFNWRALEARLRRDFRVRTRRFTPLPALGALLNSQVWFVCTPR